MATDTPDWAAYARIQQKIDTRTTLDDRAWGLEAAADALLQLRIDEDAAGLTRQTAARRERYQAVLRRTRIAAVIASPPCTEATVDARGRLRVLEGRIDPSDWRLLLSVAGGQAYTDLARVHGCSAGALRVRVVRLRRELLAA